MSTRKRKNHLIYQSYSQKVATTKECEFCKFTTDQDHVVQQIKHFSLVRNLFPYDLWDGCGILDHLMVVPRRHVDTISHFSSEEKTQYIELIAEYEQAGYSVYARAPGSVAKSVVHQHTHLIKLNNKKKKLIIYSKKPQFLITK